MNERCKIRFVCGGQGTLINIRCCAGTGSIAVLVLVLLAQIMLKIVFLTIALLLLLVAQEASSLPKCGGFAGLRCPEGYVCIPAPKCCDFFGTCVPKSGNRKRSTE